MLKSIKLPQTCFPIRHIFKNIAELLLCLLLTFSFFPLEATAEQTDMDLDSILFTGIEYIHQDSFRQGISEFEKIVKKYPDNPAGYFFIAATLQTLIDDYRNENYKKDFEKYVELAIEKGSQKVEKNPDSALDHFYLGGALGYRGIYRSFRGNWWGAFKDGKKAYSHLKKTLELDSTLYDAYFGLGAYHYWKSVKSKLFWWLPFFGDERRKGIKETELAIRKGKYARDEAAYSLLRIYLEEKDYNSVLKWSQEVKRINENDPFRLWMTGFSYINLENWSGAKDVFLQLLDVLITSPYYDPAGEYECRYWLAFIFYHMGNLESTQAELNKVIAMQSKVKGNDYAESIEDKIEDLQKKISAGLKPR